MFAYGSRSSVCIGNASPESEGQRQLKLHEDGAVLQIKWVSVGGSEKLVAAAENSVQVWNLDGSLLCLCWALPQPPASFDTTRPFYASCIAAVGPADSLFVGASSGDIFIFTASGEMVSFNRTHRAHDSCVTAMAANDIAAPSTLVSADSSGTIRVWDAFSMSSTVEIAGGGFACAFVFYASVPPWVSNLNFWC